MSIIPRTLAETYACWVDSSSVFMTVCKQMHFHNSNHTFHPHIQPFPPSIPQQGLETSCCSLQQIFYLTYTFFYSFPPLSVELFVTFPSRQFIGESNVIYQPKRHTPRANMGSCRNNLKIERLYVFSKIHIGT